MKFLWPEALALAAIVPVLIWAYLAILRRRKKIVVRYAALAALKEAMGGSGWRRHIPPVLLLLAVVSLIIAAARPMGLVTLPSQHETVILAMDVSGSMRATDVEPNRLAAAQVAAKTFIEEQPRAVRIGIVSFAATASVVQSPTNNRDELIAAIDRFQVQRGTAIGSAMVVSLATLFPEAGIEVTALLYGRDGPRPLPNERARKAEKKSEKKAEEKAVPPGSYGSAAIILLTDGQRTTGPDPLDAAKMAAERGVRIFTVGVGTTKGDVIGFEGWSMRVRLDEETLKRIAEITHGEYFYAGTAADLKKIYKALNSRFVLEKKQTEITALFAGVAAALVTLAAMLSLFWFNRII